MKIIRTSILLILLFFVSLTYAQKLSVAKKSLKYLASDKLEGRFPGTPGDSMAHAYMVKQFEKSGVKAFEDGFVQKFDMLTSIDLSDKVFFKVNGKQIGENDYQVMNFSADKHLSASVVLLKDLRDTEKPVLNGEWLLYYSKFEKGSIPTYRELIQISNLAERLGAGGLLLVALGNWGKDDEFYPFYYSRSMVRLDIPVFQISRELAETSILSVDKLQSDNAYPASYEGLEVDNITVDANVEIIENYSTTGNVYGYVAAEKSDEWVVLGAHYDHLGYGGYGSGSRSPELHEIHNGADDNASGTAMVLMLADYYAKHKPEQNMLFVLFAAEEEGLIGSKYFVEHTPVPLEKIRAMINFDMVGRVIDDKLSISGTGTAKEFESILKSFQNKPLDLALSGGGYAGSDQASFASENIPVLFFNSGLHDDYHRPDDDIDQINFKGMKQVAELSVSLLDSLMHPDLSLEFVAQKQNGKGRHYGDMKVSMGIMPDVTGRVKEGLAVDGVRPGGPAANAGIQKGDVIHKVDKYDIENIYDYMETLSHFKKGQTISIELVREEKPITLELTF